MKKAIKYVCDEILDINSSGLTIKSNRSDIFISFDECAKNCADEKSFKKSKCIATRDITKLTFTFYTHPKIRVIFKKIFSKICFREALRLTGSWNYRKQSISMVIQALTYRKSKTVN